MPYPRRGRRAGGLALVALLCFVAALAFGLAVFWAIPLGLGDKKEAAVFGWLVERRVAYQVGFAAAAVNLLVGLAALALRDAAAQGWLRTLFAAANVAAVVFLVVKSDALLARRDAPSADPRPFAEMPDTPYSDPERAAELIHVHTATAAEALRDRLTARIFGAEALPAAKVFDVIEREVSEPRFADVGAAQIDRFSLALPHGYGAIGYHFVPPQPNGRLVLYNHGHVGGLFAEPAREAIRRFLAAGYGVTAFSMPHRDPNVTPARVETPLHGTLPPLRDHETFQWLESEDFSPVRLFVEPLVVAVNQALLDGYTGIAATGISGGGWTVTVAAALDPRIRASYPVAGSLPVHLAILPPNEPQDWEQRAADIYRMASYLDLYVLGAAGAGRRQVQILNQYDACCFRGVGARGYAPAVAAAAERLGGSYRLEILPEHAHRISPEAYDIILGDLEKAFAP